LYNTNTNHVTNRVN